MIEKVWNNIIKHAGEEFETASGLPFTYIIRDDHTIIPIRNEEHKWPLSKNLFEKALRYSDYSSKEFNNKIIGSSYVRGILEDKRIM